ncbi:LURP-one-related 10-like protein, partial [Tanacetum coccineum]
MAQSASLPISVIGPEFVAPSQLELIVETHAPGNLLVSDIDHKILFRVKPADTTFHRKRLLLDPDDRPLLLLQEKNLSAHQRWNVFRGESNADSDLIFTSKSKHITGWHKMHINVFLANNSSSEDNCDFNIKGCFTKERNCTIHTHESSSPIAQMHKFQRLKNAKLTKGKYMVRVNPNVDYAFVVALIAILDGMNNADKKTSRSGAVGGVVGVLGNLA